MNTKKYCIVLEEDVMREIKKIAVDSNKTASETVNEILEKNLLDFDKEILTDVIKDSNNLKKYCIVLNEDVMKEVKKLAIDNNQTLSQTVNIFLKKDLS